jgi:pyruvate dehydrogenase E1 component alpha subunit
MGVDPKRVMAELLGKVTGLQGMGGSMHIFSKSTVFMVVTELWEDKFL